MKYAEINAGAQLTFSLDLGPVHGMGLPIFKVDFPSLIKYFLDLFLIICVHMICVSVWVSSEVRSSWIS